MGDALGSGLFVGLTGSIFAALHDTGDLSLTFGALLAAMIVSMLAAPFVIAASDSIVLRLSRAEWMQRSLDLHRVAVQSIEAERHVVIVGYGRNGQRLWTGEASYLALPNDETVVFNQLAQMLVLEIGKTSRVRGFTLE